MFIAMSYSLIQGLRCLVHHHHWILTGTPLGDSMAFLSLEDCSGIVPQGQSLHELQQVLGGIDVRVDHPKAQLCAWVLAELVSLGHCGHSPQVKGMEPSLPHPCPQDQFTLTCGERWSLLSGVQGLTLLCQGHLSCCSVQ